MGQLNRLGKDILEIGLHSDVKEERILQFGEGNFLRAFVDYFVDLLNEKKLFNGSIVVVQPIKQGLVDQLNTQDGLYTVILRGFEDNQPIVKKRLITSVSRGINPYDNFKDYLALAKVSSFRYVVSNTTEAGIAFLETDKLTDKPPTSFPAKLTLLLYERFKHFKGDNSKGFIFIPCELIDNSGDRLKETILQYAESWKLEKGFADWINIANHFTNTLVDRIVTGYPKDEAEAISKEQGYEDKLLVAAEIFNFFAIEAKGEAARELTETLPIATITDDVTPYKKRKVRILNGAHTMSVLAAYLYGIRTVGEMMDNPLFVEYLKKGMFKEILPTLDVEEAESFAYSVLDRFANPYIKHYLQSIALNSVAKFRARVLPSIIDYYDMKAELPEILTLSFAALIEFYKGNNHKVEDDIEIVEFFQAGHSVQEICTREDYWGLNLNSLSGFCEKVTLYLDEIDKHGIEDVIKKAVSP